MAQSQAGRRHSILPNTSGNYFIDFHNPIPSATISAGYDDGVGSPRGQGDEQGGVLTVGGQIKRTDGTECSRKANRPIIVGGHFYVFTVVDLDFRISQKSRDAKLPQLFRL